MPSLDQWIEAQYRRAAEAMMASVSPVGIVKHRPGFGQVIRPVRGAIVASPALADYDPDPDYFFHWFRDSAVVIDALRQLVRDGRFEAGAAAAFADFVRFSRSLADLDGRALAAEPAWRARVAPQFARYLREDAELAAVRGDAVGAETRVNADGTLDISRWARPQHDGPALRALAVLRWIGQAGVDAAGADRASLGADVAAEASALLRSDLQFTLAHWDRPSFDIWEEELGRHYYTASVAAAALGAGAAWLQAGGDAATSEACRAAAAAIGRQLDGFWLADAGHYGSRLPGPGGRSAKALDISVILAAIHAGGRRAPHSVDDPRMQATLGRLEALFDATYPINRDRGALGPAMGRYAGDVYYSGGAYYFSTLGAAEFCFRAAPAGGRDWIDRGDAYLATVRRFTPGSGEMSEQFDQRTGAQTSARHLAWSYAAFITCVAARRAAAI